jgi:hypothetical protein
MRLFFTLIIIFIASSVSNCLANDALLPFNIRAKFLGPPSNVPAFMVCRHGSLVLTGVILPRTADFVSECLAKNKTYRTLYVDLLGGDVAAALSIAKALDESGVEVVVDGRCFSACADYLLPAAKKVRLLPGSLVGVHDRRFVRYDKNGKGVMEKLSLAELSKWGPVPVARYRATEERRLAFLRKYGRSEPFHETYQRYLDRRKKFLWGKADGSFLCPDYAMWIFDKAQLKAFGLRDIDDQWAPSSQQQVDTINRGFRDTERLFFGTTDSMDRQCTFAGILR